MEVRIHMVAMLLIPTFAQYVLELYTCGRSDAGHASMHVEFDWVGSTLCIMMCRSDVLKSEPGASV